MPKKRKAHLKRPAARTRAPAKRRALTQKAIPEAIGAAFAGGILLGRFFIGSKPYALIGAPKDGGEARDQQYHSSYDRIYGADSYYDGLANTEATAKAGSAAAKWARGLRLGGHADWYIPSRGEALLAMAAGITGANAFEKRWYWTSTQDAAIAGYAWLQSFDGGGQGYDGKDVKYLVRAVRRAPI